MEGPRSVRREEMQSMAQLVDAVFMGGREGAMFGAYPQYFSEANNENHFVFVDGGRVVSHFGMDQRDVSIAGCRLRVGCVGAVATYEEYRGKGMATRLFDAHTRQGDRGRCGLPADFGRPGTLPARRGGGCRARRHDRVVRRVRCAAARAGG